LSSIGDGVAALGYPAVFIGPMSLLWWLVDVLILEF
jgi:hypothetical protein